MNKKKIIFTVLTILILLVSSFSLYNCYDIVENKNNKSINFASNSILYNVFENVYAISYDLENIGKNAALPKYITANKAATNSFYHNNIIYIRDLIKEKKNIKYYAQNNDNSLGNTNDDIKNIRDNKELKEKYQWYLQISFDENGNFSYDTLGCLVAATQNYELVWNNYKQKHFQYLDYDDENAIIHNPTNMTIYFAIPYKINTNSLDTISSLYQQNMSSITIERIFPLVAIAIIAVCLFMLLSPYETVKEIGIFKYPSKIKFEPLAIIIALLTGGLITIIYGLIIDTVNGYYIDRFNTIANGQYSELILGSMNVLSWCGLLFLFIFITYYLKAFFKDGFVYSFKNKTACFWLIKKIKILINYVTHFDINDSINKTVLKIIISNLLVILIIRYFFNFGILGIVLTFAYTILLFNLLKNKLTEIKNDYLVLSNAVKRISNGDFDVEINQDIGLFNSLGKEFTDIKNGFEKAVSEEVKSQSMKTELISNVSHDLKTPLTSIITYIDLLKDENLSDDKRKEYIDTLDRNSLRLKNLIDDLFEVSKVNSGNVQLNIVDVDIVALIQQAKFELSDQFNNKNLIFKTNYPNEKIILSLDSLKTYRIFENLLINISKYALANTRVYIDIIDHGNEIEISFKNISADEIMVSEDKLVERFVQGDTSRNTSGSGLGLAIAKSFTEVQKGTFKIAIDGDLFKAIVTFKK